MQNCGLCWPGWPQSKIEDSEKKNKYFSLVSELKTLWNLKVTFIPIVIGALGAVTEGTGGLGNKRASGDHPNYYIIEIGLKTWGDLRSLKLQW